MNILNSTGDIYQLNYFEPDFSPWFDHIDIDLASV